MKEAFSEYSSGNPAAAVPFIREARGYKCRSPVRFALHIDIAVLILHRSPHHRQSQSRHASERYARDGQFTPIKADS